MRKNLQCPAESGNQHAALVVGLGNKRDDLAGVAILRVLRPEGTMFAVFHHQAHEFHQVPDVEHAAFVLDLRECGEFSGQFAEQRVVALAPLAEYHGRAEYHHLEGVAVQRADAIFGLHLAVTVAVGGVHGGVAGNQFLFAYGSTVAIHNGAAHEYELLYAGVFRLLGAFHGQVGVHGVVEFCAFVADLAVVAVGNSCHVVNGVVLAKVVAAPGVANHVKGGHLVLAREFGLCQVVGKGGANVAVRACYQDSNHSTYLDPSTSLALRSG